MLHQRCVHMAKKKSSLGGAFQFDKLHSLSSIHIVLLLLVCASWPPGGSIIQTYRETRRRSQLLSKPQCMHNEHSHANVFPPKGTRMHPKIHTFVCITFKRMFTLRLKECFTQGFFLFVILSRFPTTAG